MSTWVDLTKRLADVSRRQRDNEKEKFALRKEEEAIRHEAGCSHDIRHHYVVASIPVRLGCEECDRELAEKGQG